MVISSRTPEGTPHQCPVCLQVAALEVCDPAGDTVCPACGQLLWTISHAIQQRSNHSSPLISLESRLHELETDSLGFVELVMELESELGISIPDAEYERLKTVRDVVRWVRRNQRPEMTAS